MLSREYPCDDVHLRHFDRDRGESPVGVYCKEAILRRRGFPAPSRPQELDERLSRIPSQSRKSLQRVSQSGGTGFT